MTSPQTLGLPQPTMHTVQVTKTLADLTRAEIAAIGTCCVRTGMMIVMMRNLANGMIAAPARIRITMLLDGGKLIAWLLMDCAGEYNPLLPDGCSIHFYTVTRHRRRGLARALFASQLDFLAERTLVAYVMPRGRQAAFYHRLVARHRVPIRLSAPFLYLDHRRAHAT